MRVWRDKYPNVIIPKNHRFTECKTCSHLKAVLKGKPEVFDSDVSDKKKINILQEIVSLFANITIFSISETLAIILLNSKTLLHDFVLQRSAKARARVAMDEHRSFVTGERKFLNKQRQNCNEDPDSFYMEIDGMDQSKTNLPHWPNCPKDINKDLLMQIHVTGVRYSDGRPADIYLYTSQFAHDSACTCTIIYKSILKVNNVVV